MNYLQFKVLFCSQFDREIFAIIDIHEPLKIKHKLLAFSLPSWRVEIDENIKIESDHSLEALVRQVVSTMINENIDIYTTYNLEVDNVKTFPTKIDSKDVIITKNYVSVMINGNLLNLKINSLDSLTFDHSFEIRYTNSISSNIQESINIVTHYSLELDMLSLIGFKINSSFSIKCYYKLFLTPVRYIKLKEYEFGDTLETMGNYTLYHLSYYEIEKYMTLDMLGGETLESMANSNILYDSLIKQ